MPCVFTEINPREISQNVHSQKLVLAKYRLLLLLLLLFLLLLLLLLFLLLLFSFVFDSQNFPILSCMSNGCRYYKVFKSLKNCFQVTLKVPNSVTITQIFVSKVRNI